jgi:ADP-ribose pyrophosphatase YjhB (NUDIX family)
MGAASANGGTRRGAQLWRYLRTAGRLLLRRPLVSVSLVPVLPDGRIILVRRVDTGRWGLPGGLVEWGEEVAETAARELMEETGLELVAVRRLQGVYSRPVRDPRTHAISITLVVEVAEEDHAPLDTLEVSDVRAFAPETLPFGALAHDHDRQLRDFLEWDTVVA